MKQKPFDLRKYLEETKITTGTYKPKDVVVEKKNPYNDVISNKKK